MKVYTHYYKAKDAENTEFRWRTLLQFGESWDILGSVVMKNPGSREPKAKAANGAAISISDKNILAKLREFDDSKNEWYEFEVKRDDTMRCISDLFKYYKGTEELNGVIQIFNIFYIKEEDIDIAIEKYKKFKDKKDFFEDAKKIDIKYPFKNNKEFEEKVLEKDFENLIMPIYLGFADFSTNEEYEGMFTERCKYFFEKSKELGMKYCSEKFEDNSFRHPRYLFRFGENDEKKKIKKQFKNNQY